jgi:hypothetical protein
LRHHEPIAIVASAELEWDLRPACSAALPPGDEGAHAGETHTVPTLIGEGMLIGDERPVPATPPDDMRCGPARAARPTGRTSSSSLRHPL